MPNGDFEDESDESWRCQECAERDIEREPLDRPEPVQQHEDGHEKAMMVGHRADSWAMDVNDQDAHTGDLARMGMYGEG